MARARELVRSGQPEQAAAVYERLVAAAPSDPGLLLKLAVARFEAGQYSQAASVSRDGAAAHPRWAPFWLFLGASRYKLERFEEAVAALERAASLQPEERNGLLMLAESLLALGRASEALPRFLRASELLPVDPRTWYGVNRSAALLRASKLKRLREGFPDSGFLVASLGDRAAAASASELAAEHYAAALARRTELGWVLARELAAKLAVLRRKLGDPSGAEAADRLAGRLQGADCLTEAVACAFRDGRLEEVLGAAGGPGSLYWASRACLRLEQESLQRLSELGGSPQLHEVRARGFAERGSHRLAARAWRAALDLDPGGRVLKTGLANALYEARDFRAAGPVLDELLAEGESPELRFLRGSALLSQQRANEAAPHLERAVELAPDLERARAELSRAYLALDRSEDAIPHLRRIVESDPNGSYAYRLATAYRRAGKKDLAAAAMRRYRSLAAGRDGGVGRPAGR